MKRVFKIIGLISLTCFSFFITEKTSVVVKNMDDIMISIRENSNAFKTQSVDAIIVGDTIIPGISGKKVNINKSYKNMKEYGSYNEDLYAYDYVRPSINLNDNKNKKIVNINKNKRMIGLKFIIKGNDNIYEILNTINNYKIKVTFFIDSNWFSNNSNTVINLIKQGHNIGFIDSADWMNVVIKSIDKKANTYCYVSDTNINDCVKENMYLVKPYNVSLNTPLLDIKSSIDKHNIFALKLSKELKKELPNIIIYIKSKGYTITNLDESVLE